MYGMVVHPPAGRQRSPELQPSVVEKICLESTSRNAARAGDEMPLAGDAQTCGQSWWQQHLSAVTEGPRGRVLLISQGTCFCRGAIPRDLGTGSGQQGSFI